MKRLKSRLYLPGEVLSSASEAAVLAGQNRLLVENDAGWELVTWCKAELIGADHWLLSGLLRGLSGSPIQAATSGANVVLADDRLVPIALGKEEIPARISMADWRRRTDVVLRLRTGRRCRGGLGI